MLFIDNPEWNLRVKRHDVTNLLKKEVTEVVDPVITLYVNFRIPTYSIKTYTICSKCPTDKRLRMLYNVIC